MYDTPSEIYNNILGIYFNEYNELPMLKEINGAQILSW